MKEREEEEDGSSMNEPDHGREQSDVKIAIVTGANSGMGMATVKALSDMGMTVIMLCRDEANTDEKGYVIV